MEFSLETLTILFAVAALAGWVDAIAGGGGLLTIPTMLFAGVSPAAAIATNKVQGSVGTLIATLYFLHRRAINFSRIKWAVTMTFIGSVGGSWAVLQIDPRVFAWIIPLLLVFVAIYFLLSPNLDDRSRRQKLSQTAFAFLVATTLGFYDGFFGPGTGSFMALTLVWFCGYGLTAATAHAKLLNFISNFSSLIYFLIFGDIVWTIGIAMCIGQVFGAWLGAKMVLKNGAKLIRPMVVITSLIMATLLIARGIN